MWERKTFRSLILLLTLFMLPLAAYSSIDAYQFDSVEKEQLYKKLVKELRCTVCQNQDIGDSNAQLAQDLRRKTYEMISAGENEDYVLDYMAQRYGDFVLYRPRLQNNTILLWTGPFIILIFAVFFLLRYIRKSSADVVLTDDDRVQAEQLLKREEK